MRLLVTPKPEPDKGLHDESLLGYVLRITERNGYETPTVILLLAGFNTSALHHCQFVFGEQWDLTGLSRLTGQCATTLSSLNYGSAPSETSVYRCLVFGNPVRRYFVNTLRPKICPDCLRESAYCRKVWELAPVTACPHHRRMLLDQCPGCRGHVSWVRSSVSVCRCGYDWRESPPSPVTESELGVVRRIHYLCNLPTGGDSCGGGKERNPLDDLDLEHALSALSFIAAQRVGVLDTTGKFLVKGRCNAELHDLFTQAEAVFEAWPANFEDFLDWKQTQPNDSKSRTGLYKDFGTLYHGLLLCRKALTEGKV